MRVPALLIALACALPLSAQEAEIFIPGASTTLELEQDDTPQARSPLARCLASPDRAACAGVALDPSGITTESAVPQISFETLVLDLNGGGVTTTPEPPARAPDYTDTRPPTSGSYALPSVAVTIEFDFDSDRIRDRERGKIAGLIAALADPALANARFAVIGHTDASGSTGYNCGLSERRATSVSRALEAAYLPVTLYPLGFGEHVLKNAYDPRAPENRRVTFLRLPANPTAVLETATRVCRN